MTLHPMTPIAVFDTETTGVDTDSARIVTAFIGVIDGSGTLVSQRDWLLDPEVIIPDRAVSVHGITTDHARMNGLDAKHGISEIALELNTLAEQKIPVVVFNAPYDLSLLVSELSRHSLEIDLNYHAVIDPLVLDRELDRYRRGKRTLVDLCELYEIDLSAAHNAKADAVASGLLAQKILSSYAAELPDDFHELHALQLSWAERQRADFSAYLTKIGKLAEGESLPGGWPIKER